MKGQDSHPRRDAVAAFDVLRAYLEARAELLQRAGDVTRHAAFVAYGCLRQYVIDAKGKEHIVQFAPETWWLADSTSLPTGTASTYFIDAIEDSDLLLLDGVNPYTRTSYT